MSKRQSILVKKRLISQSQEIGGKNHSNRYCPEINPKVADIENLNFILLISI